MSCGVHRTAARPPDGGYKHGVQASDWSILLKLLLKRLSLLSFFFILSLIFHYLNTWRDDMQGTHVFVGSRVHDNQASSVWLMPVDLWQWLLEYILSGLVSVRRELSYGKGKSHLGKYMWSYFFVRMPFFFSLGPYFFHTFLAQEALLYPYLVVRGKSQTWGWHYIARSIVFLLGDREFCTQRRRKDTVNW